MIWTNLAGPLIGAVIGYCTNYIAVKMLFYPRKEIRLFGHVLPFTPGAIPKGKDRLAHAIGRVVSDTLLTKEDIEQRLLTDKTGDGIADALLQTLKEPVKDEITGLTGLSEEEYADKKGKLSFGLADTVADALSEIDFTDIIVEKGGEIVRQKISGTMLAMFVSDELISSMLAPMGRELQTQISINGTSWIRPSIENKLTEAEQKPALVLLNDSGVSETEIHQLLSSLSLTVMRNGLDRVLAALDISAIVEEKISGMSVEDLEQLVLTVMKKELNMIVNLGALIGFLLGLLNLIF